MLTVVAGGGCACCCQCYALLHRSPRNSSLTGLVCSLLLLFLRTRYRLCRPSISFARMRKDGNGSSQSQTSFAQNARILQMIGLLSLCILFYLLGIWNSTSSLLVSQQLYCTPKATSPSLSLDFAGHHSLEGENDPVNSSATFEFKECDGNYSEYTPCHDTQRSLRFSRERLAYRERHCPTENETLRCLIPAPPGYRKPFPWPRSRDYAWFANVPHRELIVEKAVQNWVQMHGDLLFFPGGGTMFPRGANAYIDAIHALLPLSDGAIVTALDTGCGVASWGAYLMSRNITTMSIAPRDTHEAQVQFALERGAPAMIGLLATQRLPYPARAFDMAHCSRCLIPWNKYDGLYLMEIDRLLRPGGYWILSGPPINWKNHHRGWQRTTQALQKEQREIEDIARRLCWKKLVEKGDIAIWRKPTNHIHCTKNRRLFKFPPMCPSTHPDSAWYQKMEACITPLPNVNVIRDIAGGSLEKWPQRLTAVPPRIARGSLPRISAASFNEDTELWKHRLSRYKEIVGRFSQGRYRNIIDMNSYMGGFAAALALAEDPVWVMNVVPVNATADTLGIIYERGLIGTYHDWCEAFSTYPRTYDLIHANWIASIYKNRCDIGRVLVEMDRILRPEGTVIFRDDVDVVVRLKTLTQAMRWKAEIANNENGAFHTEKLLIAVKQC